MTLSARNLVILLGSGISLVLIVWGSFNRPSLGLGILLAALPVLNLARKLFPEGSMPFPSLETLAVVLLWTCVGVRGNRDRSSLGGLDLGKAVAMFAFLLSGVVSSMTSREPGLSLKVLTAGGLVPLLAYSVGRRADRPRDRMVVICGCLALASQAAMYTLMMYDRRQMQMPSYIGQEIYEWYYGRAPVVNLFVVPSATISSLVPMIPLAAWYLRFGPRFRNEVFIATWGGVVIASLLSVSRGSWMGTMVALAGSILLLPRRVRLRAIVGLLGLTMAVTVAGELGFVSSILDFRRQSGLHNASIRLVNFELALRSSSRFVLWGLGLGQYVGIYRHFPASVAALRHPLSFAHNLFFTLIPEVGLLGAIAFLFLFLKPLQEAWDAIGQDDPREEDQTLLAAVIVGVLAYAVIASTSGTHLVAYLRHDVSNTYLSAPALIVVFSLLGLVQGIRESYSSSERSAKNRGLVSRAARSPEQLRGAA